MDDAVKEYQEALLDMPDYADARLALANALRQQGKLDEAISDYRDYLRAAAAGIQRSREAWPTP